MFFDKSGGNMSGITYEHHSSKIYISELCPFKIKYIRTSKPIGANWHTNPEFIYITKGEGKVICASESFNAKAGDIFFVSPETIHQIIAERELEYYFIIIDTGFWGENGLDCAKYEFKTDITASETKELIMKVIKKREGLSDDDPISYAELRSCVLSLIINICRNSTLGTSDDSKGRSKDSDSYVKRAMNYINENYGRQLSTAEIARYVGITQSYLSREFKKHTGETVVSYINIHRCKKAGQLILRGYSITEAALECGFESGSYFSQVYKKTMGHSPSDIKNKESIHTGAPDMYADDSFINS